MSCHQLSFTGVNEVKHVGVKFCLSKGCPCNINYYCVKCERMAKNVCVVVLGDIGRSPRMQYHALSLAEKGHKVDIVGYGETQPIESVKLKPLIFYHYLMPYPEIPLPRLFRYAN